MDILKRTVNIDERLLLIDIKDLSTSKKILLTFITNFLVNNQTLFATNSYLGKRLNMHPSTVSTAINDFFEREWIGKYEEEGVRHIYQRERHLNNIEEFLGSLEDHAEFLVGLKKRKDGIAERIDIEEKKWSKTIIQSESLSVAPDVEEKPGPKPEVPKSVEVNTEPQQKEKDLTEELVDTSAGTYVGNEEFDAELDKIYESYNIQKEKESDFDALRWLKSYEEETGHEYDEFTYSQLIKEVEKRFSYKAEINADDYLTYFRWGNYRESYVSKIGDLILDTERRKKKGSSY